MADLLIGTAIGNAGSMKGPGASTRVENGTGFGEVLKQSISAVSARRLEAEELIEGLVSGQHANIHETMIAMEKASISFKLLTKVHNKVIGAYEEIQRLQL
jgi:flagellar hook-basal body complex protein FliE